MCQSKITVTYICRTKKVVTFVMISDVLKFSYNNLRHGNFLPFDISLALLSYVRITYALQGRIKVGLWEL